MHTKTEQITVQLFFEKRFLYKLDSLHSQVDTLQSGIYDKDLNIQIDTFQKMNGLTDAVKEKYLQQIIKETKADLHNLKQRLQPIFTAAVDAQTLKQQNVSVASEKSVQLMQQEFDISPATLLQNQIAAVQEKVLSAPGYGNLTRQQQQHVLQNIKNKINAEKAEVKGLVTQALKDGGKKGWSKLKMKYRLTADLNDGPFKEIDNFLHSLILVMKYNTKSKRQELAKRLRPKIEAEFNSGAISADDTDIEAISSFRYVSQKEIENMIEQRYSGLFDALVDGKVDSDGDVQGWFTASLVNEKLMPGIADISDDLIAKDEGEVLSDVTLTSEEKETIQNAEVDLLVYALGTMFIPGVSTQQDFNTFLGEEGALVQLAYIHPKYRDLAVAKPAVWERALAGAAVLVDSVTAALAWTGVGVAIGLKVRSALKTPKFIKMVNKLSKFSKAQIDAAKKRMNFTKNQGEKFDKIVETTKKAAGATAVVGAHTAKAGERTNEHAHAEFAQSSQGVSSVVNMEKARIEKEAKEALNEVKKSGWKPRVKTERNTKDANDLQVINANKRGYIPQELLDIQNKNAELPPKERLEKASAYLGRGLNEDEALAVLKAHKTDEISGKVRVLQEAGFTTDEKRILLRGKITGILVNTDVISEQIASNIKKVRLANNQYYEFKVIIGNVPEFAIQKIESIQTQYLNNNGAKYVGNYFIDGKWYHLGDQSSATNTPNGYGFYEIDSSKSSFQYTDSDMQFIRDNNLELSWKDFEVQQSKKSNNPALPPKVSKAQQKIEDKRVNQERVNQKIQKVNDKYDVYYKSELTVGQDIYVYRSNGMVEGGWKVETINHDGTYIIHHPDKNITKGNETSGMERHKLLPLEAVENNTNIPLKTDAADFVRRVNLVVNDKVLTTLSKQEFDGLFDLSRWKEHIGQGNFGNCYMVAMQHSLQQAGYFEALLRTNLKKVAADTWEIRIKMDDPNGRVIQITESDLSPQKNDNYDKIRKSGKRDTRKFLNPVQGPKGLQILEAAIIKSKFGTLDRLKAEGGVSHEALLELLSPNSIKKYRIYASETPSNTGGNSMLITHNVDTFSQANEFARNKLREFLDNYDPQKYVATAATPPHKDGDSASFRVEGKMFAHGHGYSIVRVNKFFIKNGKTVGQVTVRNPWDLKEDIHLTFDEFEKAFSYVSGGELQPDKMLKTYVEDHIPQINLDRLEQVKNQLDSEISKLLKIENNSLKKVIRSFKQKYENFQNKPNFGTLEKVEQAVKKLQKSITEAYGGRNPTPEQVRNREKVFAVLAIMALILNEYRRAVNKSDSQSEGNGSTEASVATDSGETGHGDEQSPMVTPSTSAATPAAEGSSPVNRHIPPTSTTSELAVTDDSPSVPLSTELPDSATRVSQNEAGAMSITVQPYLEGGVENSTLWGITNQFNRQNGTSLTPAEVARWNGIIDPSKIQPGQKIEFPSENNIYTVQKGDSVWKLANGDASKVQEIFKLNPQLAARKNKWLMEGEKIRLS